jgi:hypothetical protein
VRERTLGPSSAATSFWIESKTEGASDPVSWSSRSTLRSALFAPGRGGAWWHAADDTFAIGQASRGDKTDGLQWSQYLANIYSKPSGTRKIRYSSVVKPPNNLTPVRARPTPLWRRSAPRPHATVLAHSCPGGIKTCGGGNTTRTQTRDSRHTHTDRTRASTSPSREARIRFERRDNPGHCEGRE